MGWDDGYKGYRGVDNISGLRSAHCTHCNEYSLWVLGSMVYPKTVVVENPNADLPETIIADYIEASNILSDSPRGAAALLRLAIEKLVDSLEAEGRDLNAKIGDLVSRGLSPKIQKALDFVRVIGNNAVHPGQINLQDNPDTARSLFRLVNLIANEMVTSPKEVEELFGDLPDDYKDRIETRDSRS